MRKKIFWNYVLLSFLSILVMVSLIAVVMYNQYETGMKTSIRNETFLFADALNLTGYDYLDQLSDNPDSVRITLIHADGKVLFDNRRDPQLMENHLDRSEVLAALADGSGSAVRESETLAEKTYYYAVRLVDGDVIRVSKNLRSVWAALASSLPYLLLISLAVLFGAGVLARRQTVSIVNPLNSLDLDAPMSNDIYDELAPLISRISNQQKQIKSHMAELQEKQAEFNSVVNNMREGLIILNHNGNILTMNESVQNVFEIEPGNYIGKKIYALNRSSSLQNAIDKAMKGIANEEMISVEGKYYQLLANPVMAEDKLKGIILLILDITERKEAEQRRREFTANVSHELKTPLTSIRGYAEIIKDGIVRQEDIPEFTRRIYNESDRMLAMVNDIMTLSHLDEDRSDLTFESVDLMGMVTDIAERLRPLAALKKISIYVDGDSAKIMGIRRLLDEILFNVLDNAIKYNRVDGVVRVHVASDANFSSVRISDTGIGIAKEDQSRVFERFYRVDKSHSRDSGGTGLGLSIVKHGALIHGAKIDMASQLNVGTTITITFPNQQKPQ